MKILGIGRALPEQMITNQDLEKVLDTSDEWIQSRTGIKERRVMAEQNLNALAVDAAKEALKDANVDGKDIDLVLVATTMADHLFPSLSSLLAGEIGTSCPTMDIHAACTGFIYGLMTAEAYLKSKMASKVLLIGAEAFTRLVDWQDRSTCVLFGDGAGAVVLGDGEDLMSIHLSTQANDQLLFYHAPPGNSPYTKEQANTKAGLTMDGQNVFRFAVSQSEKDLNTALKAAGLSLEQVDWVLFHQANRRIIDTVRKRMNLSPEKLPMNIHRVGNTSAASIPLLLWELYHAGKLLPGQILAMSAFGAGLTSGACVLRWDKEKPAITVDENDLFPAPSISSPN